MYPGRHALGLTGAALLESQWVKPDATPCSRLIKQRRIQPE